MRIASSSRLMFSASHFSCLARGEAPSWISSQGHCASPTANSSSKIFQRLSTPDLMLVKSARVLDDNSFNFCATVCIDTSCRHGIVIFKSLHLKIPIITFATSRFMATGSGIDHLPLMHSTSALRTRGKCLSMDRATDCISRTSCLLLKISRKLHQRTLIVPF